MLSNFHFLTSILAVADSACRSDFLAALAAAERITAVGAGDCSTSAEAFNRRRDRQKQLRPTRLLLPLL